jgi:hypothetical protein
LTQESLRLEIAKENRDERRNDGVGRGSGKAEHAFCAAGIYEYFALYAGARSWALY